MLAVTATVSDSTVSISLEEAEKVQAQSSLSEREQREAFTTPRVPVGWRISACTRTTQQSSPACGVDALAKHSHFCTFRGLPHALKRPQAKPHALKLLTTLTAA